MKNIFCLLLMTVSAIAQPSVSGPTNQPPRMPEPILKLLQWPTAGILTEKRVSATATNVLTAVFGAERWLRLVIDPAWLPAQLEPLCTGGEFENRDVVRYKWVTGGHAFVVAQTGSIFVMEIRPETEKVRGDTKEERLAAVRNLCSQVFAKSGTRWTGQLEEVAIPDLNNKIVEFSLDPENTIQVTNEGWMLMGRPKNFEEEAVTIPTNEVERKAQDDKANVNWDKTAFAWMYWFRNVHCFAESERVVVYFLKEEGGPVKLSFGGAADSQWFKK